MGELISVEGGPQRNVKLVIAVDSLSSEISSPPGALDSRRVQGYEMARVVDGDRTVWRLHLVVSSGEKVYFYATYSGFDFALLLDQLDATIGVRPRTQV